MSSLSLPDDDDGPTIMVDSAEPSANPGGKNSCSHPASKPAVKKKGARKRPAAAKEPPAPAASGDLGLPSEDEGPTLELVPGPIGVPEPSKSEDSQESDLLKTYDDSTLKAAAAKIPSCVQHPYTDLEAPLRANPPCHKDLQCTVWEIFSVPRLQPAMQQLGGTCRRSYDLLHFWNLGQEKFQRTLLMDMSILQPLVAFLSPPCTHVCRLQHSNWKRMKKEKRILNLVEALHLIDFAMWVASFQLSKSRIFAFEHPWGSLAWDRESVSWLVYCQQFTLGISHTCWLGSCRPYSCGWYWNLWICIPTKPRTFEQCLVQTTPNQWPPRNMLFGSYTSKAFHVSSTVLRWRESWIRTLWRWLSLTNVPWAWSPQLGMCPWKSAPESWQIQCCFTMHWMARTVMGPTNIRWSRAVREGRNAPNRHRCTQMKLRTQFAGLWGLKSSSVRNEGKRLHLEIVMFFLGTWFGAGNPELGHVRSKMS